MYCRVATGIPAPYPTLLYDRDVGEAVFLCEIIGSSEAMAGGSATALVGAYGGTYARSVFHRFR